MEKSFYTILSITVIPELILNIAFNLFSSVKQCLYKVFLVYIYVYIFFLVTYVIYITNSNCGKACGLRMAMNCTYLLRGEILHMWWDQNLVYDMDHAICANSIMEYNFSFVVQNYRVLERQQKHFFCGTSWEGDAQFI